MLPGRPRASAIIGRAAAGLRLLRSGAGCARHRWIAGAGIWLGLAVLAPLASAERPAPAHRVRLAAPSADASPVSAWSETARRRAEKRFSFPHEIFAGGAVPRPPKPLREILDRAGVLAAAEATPDTMRVAMFRIQFETDAKGDSTTGDGRFDLRRDAGQPVDPSPHDRAYFEAHAEALARYYRVQSYGGLVLEAAVFPPGDEDAFTLSDMGNYGPWAVEQSEDVILAAERFVTDAVRAVEAAGTVDFTAFDAFVIVHAGSDFQSDIDGNSPYDIPTFTLSFGQPFLAGGKNIERVLVLPETVSQDGALGALNGVFAHEFGHILELPDLYNIFTGIPQVGHWSLMDSGENIPAFIITDPETEDGFEAFGVFPTSLDPWCKLQAFPSHARAHLLPAFHEESLEAVQVNADIPLAQIDLYEYFLIENRAYDVDGSGGFPFVRQDSLTGVFMGPEDDPALPGAGGRYEYDALLPGSGVLVWHIDDKILIPALADRGQVNLFTGFRGIALEEADGVWDQGRFNFGTPFDPFYSGNNTRFAHDSVPSSHANDGSDSGITLTVTGAPSRFMGIRVERAYARDGWPVVLREQTRLGPLAAVDLDGDGTKEALFAFEDPDAGPGALRAGVVPVTLDGDPFLFEGTTSTAFRGGVRLMRGLSYRPGVFGSAPAGDGLLAGVSRLGDLFLWRPGDRLSDAQPTASLSIGALLPPAFAGRASATRVVTALRGEIAAADPGGTAVDGYLSAAAPDSLPTAGPTVLRALDGPLESVPLPATDPVAVAWAGGIVELFPLTRGDEGWTTKSRRFSGEVEHLVAGSMVPAARASLVAVTADSVVVLDEDLREIGGWALAAGDPLALPPALGDVDGDGLVELVAALESGAVVAWNADGSRSLGWPRSVSGTARDLKLADLDADGRLDVLVLDEAGVFHGFDGRGGTVARYPRSLGPITIIEAWLEDMDGEGLTWFASTDAAALVAMRFPDAVAMPGDWRYPRGTADGSSCSAADLPATPGAPGLDGETVLVFPNPARGRDVEIRFELDSGESAEIAILDPTGRVLDGPALEYRGGARAGENSAVWRVDDVAPGLYVCRLERRGPDGSRVDFARVAVIR